MILASLICAHFLVSHILRKSQLHSRNKGARRGLYSHELQPRTRHGKEGFEVLSSPFLRMFDVPNIITGSREDPLFRYFGNSTCLPYRWQHDFVRPNRLPFSERAYQLLENLDAEFVALVVRQFSKEAYCLDVEGL